MPHCADVDRPRGNVTGETEFDDDSKNNVKIPAICRFKDHKVYDCEAWAWVVGVLQRATFKRGW